MEKLKGSLLAVKTVGRLLGRNLTEEHWSYVLDSDLWEIGSDANDIMPALALTFHNMPEHLQLCFAFCSVFPKGHWINKYELIGMWIAQGYILEIGTKSKSLEDIGEEYLEELNQLSLIEAQVLSSYQMHDLLHDLEQSVSQGEVCIYEDKRGKRISTSVRHLCVHGPVDPESVVQISSSLRTLVLYGDDICSQVDLEALKRIRVLVVIDRNMQEFPEAFTHLKHLRYLDFSRSNIKCVPESLCRLYQLRVLRLPKLGALPSLFHSLINLRTLLFLPVDHNNNQDNVHLRENVYKVKKEGGYSIAQLRNMNQLFGSLEIMGLGNIDNKDEARKANLKEKRLIKFLKLSWRDSVGAGCTHDVQEEVLESLQPHPNLKHLQIYGYMGSKSPSWLGTTPAALHMQSEAKRLLKKDTQNVTVIRLLKKLNDVGYEIQALESDLEYMELQRKVEEMNQAEADTCQSRGKKRWFSFPWAKGQSNDQKRRRLSSFESLKLPLDNMVDRISSVIKQINSIDSEMITQINVDVLFNQILLNGVYDPWAKKNKRVTTSSTNERKIYGREHETNKLIRVLLEKSNITGNISILPILGMGGIGKTTLAQFAFNYPEIENYFDKKVWVFVSDRFDRSRITKEIVESLSTDATCPKFPYDTTNLDLLESELRRRLTGKKKFLLVLDDVWSDEWQLLLAPLKLTKLESIKIIVTGRDPTALAGLETGDRILLGRLYGDEYRSFFINCVFGNDNLENYSLALQSIGEQIMEKLKGSPLAVKTVGRLLGRNLTEEHWKHVLDSDLWEIGNDANAIMPALALTFHHMPEHLQLCFAFCSVFPKGHEINKYELIRMWMAHGYILESGTKSKSLEDIGEEYLEELIQLSLIEAMVFSSCRMHDLLHDLAQSVSQGEVCIYEGKRDKKISTSVCHLCVRGPVDPESVVRISSSLRTLVLYGDDICSQVDLEALKRIRVLVVIDRNMQEFPEAFTHLKHLRYLDFSRSNIKCVPESLCRLYQLRVLRLPKLGALPSLFHSLINLRTLLFLPVDHSNNQDNVHLRENVYKVKKEGGYRIAQLRNMNQLSGSLEIMGLGNIDNKDEARKANLKEKRLIKFLKLSWRDSVGAGCTHDVQEEVLESLQPHPNLKHLQIYGYMGSKSPSWLGTTPAALHMLRRIELVGCRNWSHLPPSIGLLPFLEDLSLRGMENITIEATMIFPSLKKLELTRLASVSFEGMSLSASSSSSSTTQPQPRGRKLFPLLEELSIWWCDVVNGLPWPMLSKLSILRIEDSRGLDGQLPRCLKGLKSLKSLDISGSKCETLFDSREVMTTLERLNEVRIEQCKELISVDGLQVLPSLRSLWIESCRKLRRWWVEEEGTSEQQQQQQQQHGVKVLLPKLSNLSICCCEDLESLPAWLPLLPSLEWLEILYCPKVRSLPEGGLPSSLRKLEIDPGLMERCQQVLLLSNADEWQMNRSISRGGHDLIIFERKHKERIEEADFPS